MRSIHPTKNLLFLSLFLIIALACEVSVPAAIPTQTVPAPADTLVPASETASPIPPSATSLPPTLPPDPTSTQSQPVFEGVQVTVDPLSIVLVPGLASGVRGVQVPAASGDNTAPWDVTPGHTRISLEGYVLQGKSVVPEIYVYPAMAYVEMRPAAFEAIRRLDNILYPPQGPTLNDELPAIPFFNAQQLFAAQPRILSFQNGGGVRFVTEYGQYAASANNHDLFYHFEGLSRDGTWYIVAIFPITAPVLAETSDAGAPLPPGGVPYSYYANPGTDMAPYYATVTEVLNAVPAGDFTPTLDQLDQLIQSIQVSP